MLKILKNTTASPVEISDAGITVPASGTYTIVPQDYWIFTYSRDTIDAIVAGDIVVNDGEDDLPIRVGIALLQDNQIVVNEHYTLVAEDGVLVGNGQILHFNDEFDTTDNVPDYIDDLIIEDDDPTETL